MDVILLGWRVTNCIICTYSLWYCNF